MATAWAKPPTRVELPNGMSVIVQETYATPTVSLNVFIRAGSLHETPETTGLAHFYEHMFFRGTPTRTGLEFKKEIETLGGTTNATTSRDMTHYYINLPSQFANQGLELLADALLNAELSQEGIEKEREVVLEEYRIGENNPARIATDMLYQMAYSNHPYGRSVIGEKTKLENYQQEKFWFWKSQFYVPSRTSVVVVGDVDTEQVLAQAKKLFGNFQSRRGARDTFPTPIKPTAAVYKEDTGPVSRAFVLLGFLGPSVKDQPDVYQVDVLSFLLGQGESALLEKELVDSQLADSVSVNFLTQAEPGLIVIGGIGKPKQAEEIRRALLAALEKVKESQFTDRELQAAKNRLLAAYRFGNESNRGKADTLGYYETIHRLGFALDYDQQVQQVTREQIVAAAKKYLVDEHYGLTLLPGRRGRRR